MRPLVHNTPIAKETDFEAAIKNYIPDLQKYCLSLTKSKWDGGDLMQDTLAKAYKDWIRSQKPIVKAYLFRIASNTWIDGHRKTKIKEELGKDLSVFSQKETSISDPVYRAIELLLRELSPKQRVVMLLVEGLGLTAKETAEMLSASEGSIKATLHRARKKVKKINYSYENSDRGGEDPILYVTALRNGNPSTFVQFYHQETQGLRMIMGDLESRLATLPAAHTIKGEACAYLLLSFATKKGDILFIPFYQEELFALLLQIKEGSKGLLLAS
ncbi:RNA polymerase sigma factor [Halobacillus naozhouensis]|uniref:RNA polymerase sigma factor n=1 Tax=Halobacillus naozhouensis TaxID=554880 RepID=A0ABY8IUY8_9BACI|nr:RNA polymerase sigma factor [Halobacillus naozhouensis]WFT72998.1 RNA polymerase sigma factor [Halobacillus naozhouensis]